MYAIFFTARVVKEKPKMGKVILTAVVTLDGYLANSSRKASEWLGGDRYGIGKMKAAAHVLTPDTPLTMLPDWLERSPYGMVYLIEAATSTAGMVNGLIRMRLIDEMVIHTIPVVAGGGCRLFHPMLPEDSFECRSVRMYKDGTVRAVYGRGGNPRKTGVSVFAYVFGRLFRVLIPNRKEEEIYPSEYKL